MTLPGLVNMATVILRLNAVERRTALSRSAIYGKLKYNPNRPNEYDPTFPKPIRLGSQAVGWVESEIEDWLTAQIAKSRKTA
jgi:prophage regulatory protein